MDAIFGGESLVAAVMSSEPGKYALEPLSPSLDYRESDSSTYTITEHDIFIAIIFSFGEYTYSGPAVMTVGSATCISSGGYNINPRIPASVTCGGTVFVTDSRTIRIRSDYSGSFPTPPICYIYKK